MLSSTDMFGPIHAACRSELVNDWSSTTTQWEAGVMAKAVIIQLEVNGLLH